MQELTVYEYLQWHNEPTQREMLDCHLSNIQAILINVNSKKKVKAQDLMILFTEEDKKNNLAKELKEEFSKLGKKIKFTD